MAFPTPEQFAKNWYTAQGVCVDCEGADPQALKFRDAMVAMSTAPEIDGALQIKFPFDNIPPEQRDPVSNECIATVNSLALANPSWSKSLGIMGMLKLNAACYYEANGTAPPGFMQQVTSELSKQSGGGVPKWAWWAAGGALALLLFSRRK